MTPRAERISSRAEFARKGIHLTGGLVVLLLYGRGADRDRTGIVLLLGLAVTCAAGIEWARRASPRVNIAFERAVGSMLRPRERRAMTGATWLALTALATTAFLREQPALCTLWCIMVADPAATLVGCSRGGRAEADDGKSVIGSAAFFTTAFVGAYLVAGVGVPAALAVAAVAGLAERFPGPLDDNFTVGVATAVCSTVVA